MKRNLTIIMLCLFCSVPAFAGEGTDAQSMAKRQADWRAALNVAEFQFDPSHVGIMYSLTQFQGDCQFEFIYDPAKPRAMILKLVRAGKDLVTLPGNMHSAFASTKDVFCFAEYSNGNCGCTVVACSTHTGAKIWEKRLEAAGMVAHSAYSNRVILQITGGEPYGLESDGNSLEITGSETAGNYIEVLDVATGEKLAHRVYR